MPQQPEITPNSPFGAPQQPGPEQPQNTPVQGADTPAPQQPEGFAQQQPAYQAPQQAGPAGQQPQYQSGPGQGHAQQPDPSAPHQAQYQPGYQQQPQPTAAQGYGPQQPGALESGYGAYFATWGKAFAQLYSGATNTAIDTVTVAKDGKQENPFWTVPALINAAAVTLVMIIGNLVLASKLYSYSLGPQLLISLIVPALVIGTIISTRALVVKVIFGMRQQQIGFQESANLVSVGFIAQAPLAVFFLLVLVAPNQFFTFLLYGAAVFTSLFAEILIYTAIAKRGRFTQPIVLPYAAMTAGLVMVLTLVGGLVLVSAFESALQSLLF